MATVCNSNGSNARFFGSSAVFDESTKNWYLFFPNLDAHNITRLKLDEAGANTLTTNTFANTGASSPNGCFAVIDYSANKRYLFVASRTGSKLNRLEFGSSFDNTPVVVNMGDLSGELSTQLWDIQLAKKGNSFYMITTPAGGSDVDIFSFPSGLANAPTRINGFTSVSGDISMDLFFMNQKWYAAGTTQAFNGYIIVEIGANITDTPKTPIQRTNALIVNSLMSCAVVENGLGYLFMPNRTSGDVIRIALGNDPANTTNHTLDNLGVLGVNSQKINAAVFTRGFNVHLFFAATSAPLNITHAQFNGNCSLPKDTVQTLVPNDPLSFSTASVHSIGYQACNATGCRDTVLHIRTVSTPVANYTAPPTCEGNPTRFNNTTTIDPNDNTPAYLWDFGDGSPTSTDINPSYVFPPGGPYSVQLQVSTAAGCIDLETKLVSVNPSPDPGFTAALSCGQDSLLFTNTTALSSGSIVLARWFMGNGQVLERTATAMVPFRYRYLVPGTYTTRMIVFTDQGCVDSLTQTVVQPGVSFETTNACLGQTATFTATAIAPTGVSPLNYTWDFGDGSNPTITGDNTSHNFPFEGTYPVQVTVSLDNGCDLTVERNVQIAPPPVAAFTSSQRCAGLATQFTHQSTTVQGTITQWAWDFGDPSSAPDNTSALANPTHTYTTAGDYTVTLTVTNSLGCTHSIQHQVAIAEAVSPTITTPTVICQGQPSTFQTEVYNSYVWQIPVPGGTLLSTLPAPSFTFTQTGNFTVQLTVADGNGCSLSTSQNISVNPIPTVNYTYTTGTDGLLFTDSTYHFSSSAGAGDWEVNGESAGLGQSTADISFPEPGTYVVTLRVTTPAGCTVTRQKTLTVINAPMPILDLSVEVLEPTRPLSNLLQPRVRVRNAGNRTITQFVLNFWPEGNQPLSIPFTHTLAEGAELDTLLQLTWPPRSSVPYSFFCVAIASVNNQADTLPTNNQLCAVLDEGFMLDALYPNPAGNTLWARFSSGEARPVFIQVLSAQGTTQWQGSLSLSKAGVHTWSFDTQKLAPGLYILQLQQGNSRIQRTFQVLH
ncbi:MAG: PKD domain-containing protein [Bacteroidetes bacterium]|nr:PKD domain-containing protein [Bacteroidota bacterium]